MYFFDSVEQEINFILFVWCEEVEDVVLFFATIFGLETFEESVCVFVLLDPVYYSRL